MRKNYLMRTNFLLRSLLSITFLLTTAACGACKDDDKKDKKDKKDEKTSLKFNLTPPTEKSSYGVTGTQNTSFPVGELIIKVTEGKDDAANYKVRISDLKVLTTDDHNPANVDAGVNTKAILETPINDTSLKTIFGEDVLEKDKTKSVPVTFMSQAIACTSKSGELKIAIVNKDGTVVGGPIEVKWTEAFSF
jgi:hypothetical protein